MTGVADQGQTKIDFSQAQANCTLIASAHTNKSVDIAGANGDQIGLLNDRAIGEHHFLCPLLNCKATIDTEKTEQVNVKPCSSFDDLAFTAGHAQGQNAAGASRNAQRCVSSKAGVVDVYPAIVDHFVTGFAGLVDEDVDARG